MARLAAHGCGTVSQMRSQRLHESLPASVGAYDSMASEGAQRERTGQKGLYRHVNTRTFE
jgi:hypothetical protein